VDRLITILRLEPQVKCITKNCDGTLEFKGRDIKHEAIYVCKRCQIVIGVINPPVKRKYKWIRAEE